MSFYREIFSRTEEDRKYLLEAPIIEQALRGQVTGEQYLAFLTQAYHHVKHTIPLLMACGSRLPERLEWLRKSVVDYINEEYGHQEWILNDIAIAGGDATATRNGTPGVAVEMMVSYAYDGIYRANPVSFFGMVFVLEGTSVMLATKGAEAIQTSLGLPATAFSYLFSHGALDQDHVRFLEASLDKLDDAGDQNAVLHAAGRFYRLYAGIFRALSQQ